ncbi:hypothetical protein [Prochlorococcus sp. MIT 0707]|uniref:hypothetical protein n=1 Tax=Prochlorococcus sp. MIT 0707 TaxID=3082860 RepID=UPI0039A718D1
MTTPKQSNKRSLDSTPPTSTRILPLKSTHAWKKSALKLDHLINIILSQGEKSFDLFYKYWIFNLSREYFVMPAHGDVAAAANYQC